MARRRPRVNQESLPRASLAGWRSGRFFGRGWIVGLVPHAGRDRPIEGESHDQYQAGETVGIAQMGLLETKPARFEIGKHGLDAPARGVSQGGEISGLADMAMIQGSVCPGSRMTPRLVVIRLPVRMMFSK